MVKIDIDPITERIYNSVTAHKTAPGTYCRTTGNQAPNAYGCADAANILYTLGKMPTGDERSAHICAIQSFQNKDTGIFFEETHSDIHTTAHCTAALELFDARPKFPFYQFEKYLCKDQLYSIFENVNWLHCGKAAHDGAGIYAAFSITNAVGNDWKRAYFDYLNKHCDKETGLWIKPPTDERFSVYFQIGDAFHYLFNYENAKEAFPYPDRLIDSCIDAYKKGKMGKKFTCAHGFIQMDWVYCINRASRQTPHRFYETKEILWDFAKEYTDFLMTERVCEDPCADDLHLVFGTLCCLAELNQALPGKIHSTSPLRLVLDRRPFI